MSPDKRLEKIINDGLCIGCGLCTAIAGEAALPFGRDDEGEPRPFAGPALDDAVMDLVYDICPGFNLEGLPREPFDADLKGIEATQKLLRLKVES